MSDKPTEPELVDYEPELFVGDGELWLRDRDAFCDKYGAIGIDRCDGGILVLIPGKGAVPMDELLRGDKTTRPLKSV